MGERSNLHGSNKFLLLGYRLQHAEDMDIRDLLLRSYRPHRVILGTEIVKGLLIDVNGSTYSVYE